MNFTIIENLHFMLFEASGFRTEDPKQELKMILNKNITLYDDIMKVFIVLTDDYPKMNIKINQRYGDIEQIRNFSDKIDEKCTLLKSIFKDFPMQSYHQEVKEMRKELDVCGITMENMLAYLRLCEIFSYNTNNHSQNWNS